MIPLLPFSEYPGFAVSFDKGTTVPSQKWLSLRNLFKLLFPLKLMGKRLTVLVSQLRLLQSLVISCLHMIISPFVNKPPQFLFIECATFHLGNLTVQ